MEKVLCPGRKIEYLSLLKHLFVWVFLSLLVFNILGYYIVFYASQHQYRSARFERLKTKNHGEEPKILKFSLQEKLPYFWVKDGEIMFDGKLYDVVEEKTTSDSIIFLAYEDHKEQKMLAEFDEFVNANAADLVIQNKLPKKPSKPDDLKKILKDYIPDSFKNQLLINKNNALINFGEKPDLYLSIILSISDNPPEVFKV